MTQPWGTHDELVDQHLVWGHQRDPDCDRDQAQERQYHAYRRPRLLPLMDNHRLDRRLGFGNLGPVRSERICKAVRGNLILLACVAASHYGNNLEKAKILHTSE